MKTKNKKQKETQDMRQYVLYLCCNGCLKNLNKEELNELYIKLTR